MEQVAIFSQIGGFMVICHGYKVNKIRLKQVQVIVGGRANDDKTILYTSDCSYSMKKGTLSNLTGMRSTYLFCHCHSSNEGSVAKITLYTYIYTVNENRLS